MKQNWFRLKGSKETCYNVHMSNIYRVKIHRSKIRHKHAAKSLSQKPKDEVGPGPFFLEGAFQNAPDNHKKYLLFHLKQSIVLCTYYIERHFCNQHGNLISGGNSEPVRMVKIT